MNYTEIRLYSNTIDSKVTKKRKVYYYEGVWTEQKIELCDADLRDAEVGKTWSVEHQTGFDAWTTTITLVYKDNSGYLLVRSVDGYTYEIVWFERPF